MAVLFQAIGTGSSATTGTLTVPWPVHLVDDIGLLFVNSSAGGTVETLATANGFTYLNTYSTGTGTAGTKIAVYWARATTNTMASPILTAGSDYKYGVIATFRGAITTGSPINVYDGGVKASASTAASITSVTTTVTDTYIVNAIASDLSSTAAFVTSYTNANLSTLTKRFDTGTTSGLGGQISFATGAMATAGPTGTTNVVLTSSINAFVSLALIPAPHLTSFVNTFEGGTDGVAITNGNSGGASGLQLTSTLFNTGASITFSNIIARGTLAMKITYPTNTAAYGIWNWESSVRSVARFYVYFKDFIDPSYFELMRFRNATSTHTGLITLVDSCIRIRSFSVQATSVIKIQPNSWYRFELAVTKGTTTSNGRVEFVGYDNDSLTPFYSYDSGTTADTGTTDLSTVRLGSATPAVSDMTVYYDDFSVQELASGFIGPSATGTNYDTTQFLSFF
ncbi:MAG: hypothetical protein JWO54_749 [Candidatus Saccharibacteria bacterium]|nr:hypothetical protein [Candidatus Saccharibacteria bacterium]